MYVYILGTQFLNFELASAILDFYGKKWAKLKKSEIEKYLINKSELKNIEPQNFTVIHQEYNKKTQLSCIKIEGRDRYSKRSQNYGFIWIYHFLSVVPRKCHEQKIV